MLQGYKIIAVFASETTNLEHFEHMIHQLLSFGHVIDGFQIYVDKCIAKTAKTIKNIDLLKTMNVRINICNKNKMFTQCCNVDTIYVYFDSNIILIDTLSRFVKFIEFRIGNPKYFLVFANVLNNVLCSHILQRQGRLPYNKGITEYVYTDPIGCMSGEFAKSIHTYILGRLKTNADMSAFHMNCNWELLFKEHIDLHCMSWLGSHFATFGGCIDSNNIDWLTSVKTEQINKNNIIFGNFVLVNYSYPGQHKYLADAKI